MMEMMGEEWEGEEEHDERRMADHCVHRALLAAKSVLVLHSAIAIAAA